jgi:hypothetical protein
MTVVYRDNMGLIQKPEFQFIPRNVKQVNFINEAASRITELRRKYKAEATATNSHINDGSLSNREVVQVEREIIKETLVKIRCLKCRGFYDESLDKCPQCGTVN